MELSSSSRSDFLRSKRNAPPVHVEEAEKISAEHATKEVKVEKYAIARGLLLPDDVVQHIGLSVSGELVDKLLLCLRLSQVSHGFRTAMDGNNHSVWQRLSGKESKPSTLTWKQEALLSMRFDHCMQAFSAAKGDVEIIKAASDKLLATAKQGHPRAAAICGYSLYADSGWPPFKETRLFGKKLLIQACDAGDVVGKFWCTLYGLPTGRLDRETAWSIVSEFLRSHPNHNDDYVLFLLGWCYYSGVGTRKDTKMAFELFQESATLGNPLAMQYIGSGYVTVNGSQQALQHSFNWWQKAAECGDARATYLVGRCFMSGNGVLAKDEGMAIEWWKKAATLGYSGAIANLKKINEMI